MANPRNLLAAGLVIGLLALAGGPEGAEAQILYGQPADGGLNLVSTHWTLTGADDEIVVDQWAVPLTAYVPLANDLEARCFLSRSRSKVTQAGRDYELEGLSDLRLQVSGSLSQDRVLLGLGVNLPTGRTGLSLDDEWVVMNFLSQSFLSLPVRRLGQGFGANFMAGLARDSGDWRLGASAALDVAGSYEAYAGEGRYRPGRALSLSVGAQNESPSRVWDADATFTTSSDDELRQTPVFSRGEQLALHLGVRGGREARRYHLDATWYLRGRNAVYDPTGVLTQQLKVYGNELRLGGSLDLTRSDSAWTAGPHAMWHLVARNEYGLGRASVAGFGAQVGRRLDGWLEARLAYEYYSGSAAGGDIDLAGHQLWLAASGSF